MGLVLNFLNPALLSAFCQSPLNRVKRALKIRNAKGTFQLCKLIFKRDLKQCIDLGASTSGSFDPGVSTSGGGPRSASLIATSSGYLSSSELLPQSVTFVSGSAPRFAAVSLDTGASTLVGVSSNASPPQVATLGASSGGPAPGFSSGEGTHLKQTPYFAATPSPPLFLDADESYGCLPSSDYVGPIRPPPPMLGGG